MTSLCIFWLFQSQIWFVLCLLFRIFVSVTKIFIHSFCAPHYSHYFFGELAQLIHCLLRKKMLLSLAEQWDQFLAPNHSKFSVFEAERFVSGARVLVALKKVGIYYLKDESTRDRGQYLEEYMNSVPSTVAARPIVLQGLSCFCPSILIGGDDNALFRFISMRLVRLLEKGKV